MIDQYKSFNIRTKLMLLGLGCIFITALAMVIVGIWQGNVSSVRATCEVAKLANADLDHITEGVYSLIQAQDESIQQKVNHDLSVARYILNNSGQIYLSAEIITWRTVNQYTKEQTRIDLPKMKVGMTWLGQNNQTWVETPMVDVVKRLVGGTATIFQRMNDEGDMLRVATNVLKKDGTRAIGTYIPALNPDGTQNPVVSTVMRGETYRGIAYVVNAWYVTAFEPIYDQEKRIIGALYVGVKQENIEALREAILQVRIGLRGYVFVLGGKGDDQGHYIISKDGRRDGENLWESTDAQGRKFVQSIVHKAINCKPGEYATERYPWQNSGELEPQWKIARLTYYEPWDWVIGAAIYEDELQKSAVAVSQGYKAMTHVFAFVAMVVAALGGIITWLFARRMSNTLQVVTHAATKLTEEDLPRLVQTMDSVNAGDLTVTFQFGREPVEVDSRDELGTMARAFTSMNMALVDVGMAFTKMVANLRHLTGQLEQRVAERTAELRESERRLADIIDFLPDATLVIDKNGHVIAWNRAMEKMTGITSEEMLAKGNYEYAIPLHGKRRPILIDLVLNPNEAYEQKYEVFRKKGKVLFGEFSSTHLKNECVYLFGAASALYDSNGVEVGAIETLRDITAWKQIEKELTEARCTAENATKAKSDFLANMSHEIRTPLNGVIGMTSMLLDTDLSAEQREFAKTAVSGADALLTVVNDILDFSKIEAGKLDFEHIDFDLHSTIDSLAEMLKPQASEKGLELVCCIDPEVSSLVQGDPGRLRQVLLNLTTNALKFTEKGEVRIHVDSKAETHDQVELFFEVKDTGMGIPEERAHRLFKSFSQVDSSTTRKYGGTGLGLAICKKLVEMMGGQIGLESLEGKGSTFWFTVVLDKQVAEKKASSSKKIVTRPAMAEGRQQKFPILLAEDNPINRKVAMHILQKLGYAAEAVTDGRQAVEAFSKNRYDLVLMDVQMPVMDGYEATRAIRASSNGHSTMPILAMTASAMKGDREKCLDAGMDDYISKPVILHDLQAKIEKWVGETR